MFFINKTALTYFSLSVPSIDKQNHYIFKENILNGISIYKIL
jgi:hypothetical protein